MLVCETACSVARQSQAPACSFLTPCLRFRILRLARSDSFKTRPSREPSRDAVVGPQMSENVTTAKSMPKGHTEGYGARSMQRDSVSRPIPDGRHHLLVPVSVVVSASLLYGAHLSFPIVAAVALGFIGLYLAAPQFIRRSRDAFDQDALKMRASGKATAASLRARFEQARLFRWLDAPAEVDARRGMIALEAKDSVAAKKHYADAISGWSAEPPLGVLAGYAHAAYDTKDDVEAVVSLQRLLERGGRLPHVHARLAHATLRSGLPSEHVSAWLSAAEQAGDETSKVQVALLRALQRANDGDAKAAHAALKAAPKLEVLASLRCEVEAALKA